MGPWRAEVGYEVLYWIPFLRFLTRRFGIEPAEVVAVSRGGAAAWYREIADRYVDAFDLMSPEEFRSGLAVEWERAGGQKQGKLTPFDASLLEGVRARIGPFRLLHPSLMFRLFERVWKGGASLGHVLGHSEYERWTAPEEALVASLPECFVAAKFYFRGSFPDTESNRALVERALSRLSADRPVVLLETGLQLDDHTELAAGGASFLRPLEGVAPERNLHAQTAVVARADAFVGTYGGFSYLAPAYGVRSVALVSEGRGLFPIHLDVARRAAAATGASFTLLDVSAVERLGRPG